METQINTVEADNVIPYPLDEFIVDYEVQGPSLQNKYQMEVLLAACQRENIVTRQAVVELRVVNPRSSILKRIPCIAP